MNKHDLMEIFRQKEDFFINDWKDFLSFSSVSADPLHNEDCIRCAEWLAAHLENIGFESRLLETSGKPVVFAERRGLDSKPVILFYGHYDVQPVDPLEKWETPPFKPSIRNGRVYARGAEDNKGQVMFTIKALQTLIEADALDATVKIIIEGEEENGSRGIKSSLDKWKDFLAANILMVADTCIAPSGAPAITMGLRGIGHLTITLSGLRNDLHSGVHGGLCPNPAEEIARLIATIRNRDGSIAVEGFLDGIIPPSEAELEAANSLSRSDEEYISETGVPPVAGEKELSMAERTGFRPSIDVNGISGGYSGHGTKTIIPASAMVKLSMRLVPGQDPEGALYALKKHFEKHAPAGLRMEMSDEGIGGPGFRLKMESGLATKAAAVLASISEKEPVYLWEGASIPVVSSLASEVGAEPLLVGFGTAEDKIHAPNESFSIKSFEQGYLYTALIIQEF